MIYGYTIKLIHPNNQIEFIKNYITEICKIFLINDLLILFENEN